MIFGFADVPESNGFTQIWVVVDRLMKMANIIPMVTGKESPAKDLAITLPEKSGAYMDCLRTLFRIEALCSFPGSGRS